MNGRIPAPNVPVQAPASSTHCFLAEMNGRIPPPNAPVQAPAPSTHCFLAEMNSRPSVDNRACAKVRDLKPEAFTKPFLDFLLENPTVFHAVDYFKSKLNDSGYTEVNAPSDSLNF